MYNSNRKGFTLIEIIVSLAIIGIIAASILSIFTGSYSLIFSMGRRTNAMADAKNYMDLIYQNEKYSGVLPGNSWVVPSKADLTDFSKDTTKTVRCYIESPSISPAVTLANTKIKSVTISVFYDNGNRVVTLTSLIPLNKEP